MTRLVIVTGPPCSGKSTYIRSHKTAADLVFDYDAMQNALCLGEDHRGKPHLIQITNHMRDSFIEFINKGLYSGGGTVWKIYSFDPQTMANRFFGVDVEVLEINPGESACLERLALDNTRPDKDYWTAAIHDWFRSAARRR